MSDDGRLLSAVEKLEAVVDKLFVRVERLEVSQASSGKPSWGAVIAGVVALISILTPLSGWITTATENRVLQAELAREERMAKMETLLSVAMRER